MGLFRSAKKEGINSINDKISNLKNVKVTKETLDETQLKLSLLEDKIYKFDISEIELLEKDLINTLFDIKESSNKILWDIYLPYNDNGVQKYKKVDCVLIRNDKLFVFSCEDYKSCIGFKEVNNEVWEFEYFTNLKLEKNLISKIRETTLDVAKYLNLESRFELFVPVVILVGANSSKNIFKNDDNIYLRDSHRRFLKERLNVILEKKEHSKVLSDKWVLKITEKLFNIANPDKKTLKKYKKIGIL